MAMLSAIAIVLHMTETAMQLPLPAGMKLGLANIIAIVVIELYGVKEMFIVNSFRVIVSGLMTGIFMSYPFFISCSGVLLSSIAMLCIKKLTALPTVSISVVSAFFHNVGQILVVIYLFSSQAISSYLFVLLASSIPTGIFVGLVSVEIIKRLNKRIT